MLVQPLMKVSFVSPKYWAIKLPFLAVRSALQLVFCLNIDVCKCCTFSGCLHVVFVVRLFFVYSVRCL